MTDENTEQKRETIINDFSEFFRLEGFFRKDSTVKYYQNGALSAKNFGTLENYEMVNAALIASFSETPFGAKIIKMAKEHDCKIIFNPEEVTRDAEGKLIPKNKTLNGEFRESMNSNVSIKIYAENPATSITFLEHEARHFEQNIRAKKAFDEKFSQLDYDFDKYFMISLVNEADAFASQAEQAFILKDKRKSVYEKAKESLPFVLGAYEAEYAKSKNKDLAYSSAFEAFFTAGNREKFYTNYYINQYIKNRAYNRKHKEINIAKYVQILTGKRYKKPDDIEKLTFGNFNASLDNWYKLNKIYATNCAFTKDSSYTKLGTFNSDFKKDFKRIREVMVALTKENYEKRKTDAGLNRIRARKKFYQHIKSYEQNNIKPTSFGDFHKSFKEWLYLEEIAVKKSNKPQNMVYINELKGFLNTIDVIKGKKADINQDRIIEADFNKGNRPNNFIVNINKSGRGL